MKYLILLLSFNVHAQIEVLKNFHEEEKIIHVIDDNVLSDVPVLISHTPEVLSSIKYLKKDEDHFVIGEVELLKRQIKKIKILESLPIETPTVHLGLLYNFKGKPVSFISFKQQIRVDSNQGFGLKATLISKDWKDLIDKSTGVLSTYYFFNVASLVSKKDFASFFIGWNSDEVPIDFDNFEVKEFNFIENVGKQLTYGLFYSPNLLHSFGIGLEGNHRFFSLSVYYGIK